LIHFRQFEADRSILARGREPINAKSQSRAVAAHRHLYRFLYEILGVVLKQFIEQDSGRIPAPPGLTARISALAFSKFTRVSIPEFVLKFSGKATSRGYAVLPDGACRVGEGGCEIHCCASKRLNRPHLDINV
jgi:hypothetical protein